MAVTDTQVGRYLDLSTDELVVAARALGFDAAQWPWFPRRLVDEASSAVRGPASAAPRLEARGLVKRDQRGAHMHPYLAQAIEIAARPSLIGSFVTLGPGAGTVSWLFAEPEGAAAFSWLDDPERLRVRLLPTDWLPHAMQRLAGLDPNAASGPCAASIPASVLAELRDVIVAASQSDHDADLAHHPRVEALSAALSSAVQASVVTVFAREEGGAVRGEAVVWVTNRDGSLCALDVAIDGSFAVSPVDGRALHDRFVAMLRSLPVPSIA